MLDRARTLVYRGAIDDQYGLGYAAAAGAAAFTWRARWIAVLADERPEVAATTAPGCVLSLGAAAPAVGDEGHVSQPRSRGSCRSIAWSVIARARTGRSS